MEAIVRFGAETKEERLVFEVFLRFFAGFADIFAGCAFLFLYRFSGIRNSKRRFGLPGCMSH